MAYKITMNKNIKNDPKRTKKKRMIKEEEKINDEEEKKREKTYGIFKIKHLIRYKYVALR